ncbi:hypothetical protein AC1031_003657 [Aphanomyces cochlioides]|nr:hypothetical protein AC1031_003657 [Aphanomyces cochlioides]
MRGPKRKQEQQVDDSRDTDKRVPHAQETQPTGDDILRMRLAESTRKQYNTIIRRLYRWLANERPHHIVDGKISLPLDPDACKDFLTFESFHPKSQNGDRQATIKFAASINGCRSAITHLHREANVKIPDALADISTGFMSGFKLTVAAHKENGTMPIGEGKDPVSFHGYMFLAKMALDGESDTKSFRIVHPFLLLCWNLIAPSATVGSLRFDHITWEGMEGN